MDTGDSERRKLLCTLQVRLVGSVSLACFLGVLAARILLFPEPSRRAFVTISLACLAFSWLASVAGFWLLARHPEGEPAAEYFWPGTVANLARYALYLGIFSFVVFFAANAP